VAGESRGLRLSTSTTTRFSVATEALRHALRSMRRLGGRIPGAAVWRLTEDGLEVEWKGGAHGLAIERLHGPAAAIRVASGVMISLAKNLPADGVVEVVIGPDEVRLRVATVREGGVTRGSTMVIPREDVGEGPTALLPVGAGDLQILMLGYQHDAEVIANAGLTDAVAERREKARESIRRAATTLAWLGIDEKHLTRWVRAHLQAITDGRESFRIAAGPAGGAQLELFG
jgi:hypothetical protein